MIRIAALGLVLALAAGTAAAQNATFPTRSLTPETALKAAQAALEHCRKQGWQAAVAVVDRSGIPQVMLRDRFAGPHTVRVSINKAWTAASFRTPTRELAAETQAGRPMSGIRNTPRFVAVGGGQLIEASGSSLGAIGVSGAPGGDADDACAAAGIKAIADAIEF